MSNIESLKLFEEKKVRTVWDENEEKWYFSVIDVVAVLTDSNNPRNYWKVLKHRLIQEGNETVTNCNQLKLNPTTPTLPNNMGRGNLFLLRCGQSSTPCDGRRFASMTYKNAA